MLLYCFYKGIRVKKVIWIVELSNIYNQNWSLLKFYLDCKNKPIKKYKKTTILANLIDINKPILTPTKC